MSAIERCIQDLIRGDESDADLDKIVADLIVREAQEKNRSSTLSIDARNAIEASRNSKPSARKLLNSRFLNGVVQSVERHNRSLKADEERDSNAAISRGSSPDLHNQKQQKYIKPSSEGIQGGSSKGRLHTRADTEKDKREVELHRKAQERYHQEGPSSSRQNERRDDKHTFSDKHKRFEHPTHNSENLKPSLERESRQHEKDRTGDDDRNVERQDRKRKRELDVSSRSESKMDKYFQSDYDPALDVDARVHINRNNLVDDEGWDRAMRVIEERKRAKKERREERRRDRKHRRDRVNKTERRKMNDGSGPDKESRHQRGSGDQIESKSCREVLETQYTAKGSVREWDKGKG